MQTPVLDRSREHDRLAIAHLRVGLGDLDAQAQQLATQGDSIRMAIESAAKAGLLGAGISSKSPPYSVQADGSPITDIAAGMPKDAKFRVDIKLLNRRNYLDVSFTVPTGSPSVTIDLGSITDLTPEFTLSGPGLGDVLLDEGQAPLYLEAESTSSVLKFRYWLNGNFADDSSTRAVASPNRRDPRGSHPCARWR